MSEHSCNPGRIKLVEEPEVQEADEQAQEGCVVYPADVAEAEVIHADGTVTR